MDFRMPIGKDKSCTAVVVSSREINEVPGHIGVCEEAAIVDALLPLIQNDPQTAGSGFADRIYCSVELVRAAARPGSIAFTNPIIHRNTSDPRHILKPHSH